MGCICPKPNVEGGTSVDYVEFGKYIGERNCCGQRNGHGQYYYDNGDMYDGTWKRNRKHGYGKYTFCNGKIIEGFFENDEYLGELVPSVADEDADNPLSCGSGLRTADRPMPVVDAESKAERDHRRMKRQKRIEEMKKKYGIRKT